MHSKVMKVLKWAGILFVAAFLISQMYSSFVNPVTTDTVYKHSSFSGYSLSGYIVRNETVVESTVDGTLSFEIDNGGRVAKNGVIAKCYINEDDANKQIKIEQLDEQIKLLENLQIYNDLNAADINFITNKIHNSVLQVADSTQNGVVSDSEEYSTLLQLINRYQIVVGQISDFKSLITTLKAERDALKASVVAPLSEIKSSMSGYVVYTVDGFEGVISPENLDSITVADINNITANEKSALAVCKIVSDHEWYIASEIPFEEALKLKEGQSVKLKTTLQSSPEIKATVRNINKQSIGDNVVVVFSCNAMSIELAAARNIEFTVVYEEYEGLKVDNRAIRIVDGVTGVYVLTASQVKFVPISVMWQGENYSIVKQEASTNKVLRIYDEIIVKGKNLYDGKFIK